MPLVDLFFSMFIFFLWIAWIWIVISVIMDIFRSDDLNGWSKALWAIFVVLLPFLGIFVYLIARGDKMQERTMQMAQDRDAATREYVRQAAGPASSADELQKLQGLKDAGTISDAEFAQLKANVLGS
ncbi:MAG: SHOCT domain-containing protein [Acidimicrobiales bacterium]